MGMICMVKSLKELPFQTLGIGEIVTECVTMNGNVTFGYMLRMNRNVTSCIKLTALKVTKMLCVGKTNAWTKN